MAKLQNDQNICDSRIGELENLNKTLKDNHAEELFRKNREIEDLSQLNDEAIKTANDNTFSEKKANARIKKLKDELKDLKKEYDHRERCYKKVHDENDELRAENSKMSKLVSGQWIEEMKKLQYSNDEKDR